MSLSTDVAKSEKRGEKASQQTSNHSWEILSEGDWVLYLSQNLMRKSIKCNSFFLGYKIVAKWCTQGFSYVWEKSES